MKTNTWQKNTRRTWKKHLNGQSYRKALFRYLLVFFRMCGFGYFFSPVRSHWCGRRGSKPSRQTWPMKQSVLDRFVWFFPLQTLTRDTRLNHNSLKHHLDEYELPGCVDMGSQLQPISLLQRAISEIYKIDEWRWKQKRETQVLVIWR